MMLKWISATAVTIGLAVAMPASAQVVDMAIGEFYEPAGLSEGMRLTQDSEIRMNEGSLLVIAYRFQMYGGSGPQCQVFEYIHNHQRHRVGRESKFRLCQSSIELDALDDLITDNRRFVHQVAFIDGESFVFDDGAGTRDNKWDRTTDRAQSDEEDKGGADGEVITLSHKSRMNQRLKSLAKPKTSSASRTQPTRSNPSSSTPTRSNPSSSTPTRSNPSSSTPTRSNPAASRPLQRVNPVKLCYDSVQGRIAWDGKRNVNWGDHIVMKLCEGASRQSPKEPGRCFDWAVRGRMDGRLWSWVDAIELCKGAANAKSTLHCVQAQPKNRSTVRLASICNPAR